MDKFLIELEHEPTKKACRVAIETILSSGSHFLTNAEWGCEDNVHCCWIIVEMSNKEEVRQIIPPIYRNQAKITQIKRYTLDEFRDEQTSTHK